MKRLISSINKLLEQQEHSIIEEKLRDVLLILMQKYHLDINGTEVYLTEAEAYYYNSDTYKDDCVHRNDLQRNHFGQLYVHRAKKGGDQHDAYKGRAGVDLCLSSGNYHLAILIRSIKIGNSDQRIIGPVNVRKELIRLYGGTDEKRIIEKDENDTERASVLRRNEASGNLVLYSERIGLTTGFVNAELRAVCDDHWKCRAYKMKEQMVRAYIKSHSCFDSIPLLGYTIHEKRES